MISNLRILISDDHKLVRDGIRYTLRRIYSKRQIGWIHESSSGLETIRKIRKYTYDVVLLDIAFPDISGIEVAAEIMRIRPKSNIITLTMHDGNFEIRSMFKAGAKGYLLKSTRPDVIKKAISTVVSGKKYISAEVKRIMGTGKYHKMEKAEPKRKDAKRKITPRQQQILQLIAQGFTNEEMAERLRLKKRTIETHRFALQNRLGVRNMAELLGLAFKLGYIKR